jgi:sporulation protein YlmC with PRC-barrel domain
MLSKILIGCLLASTIVVSATAQSPTTPTTGPATTNTTSPTGQWRAYKLVGLNVYNDQDEKLGDISEILIDQSGKVTGIIIGVGGFLGIGQHDIKVAMDQLKFVNEPRRVASRAPATTGSTATNMAPATTRAPSEKWYPDHAIMAGATKDSLKNQPEFKYD